MITDDIVCLLTSKLIESFKIFKNKDSELEKNIKNQGIYENQPILGQHKMAQGKGPNMGHQFWLIFYFFIHSYSIFVAHEPWFILCWEAYRPKKNSIQKLEEDMHKLKKLF